MGGENKEKTSVRIAKNIFSAILALALAVFVFIVINY